MFVHLVGRGLTQFVAVGGDLIVNKFANQRGDFLVFRCTGNERVRDTVLNRSQVDVR